MTIARTIGVAITSLLVASIVSAIVLPKGHPLNATRLFQSHPLIHGTEGDVITMEKENKVKLFIYTGCPVTSRKWSSFYDRRHTGSRSDLIRMISETHRRYHTIGPIVEVTDNDLMDLLRKTTDSETIRAIAGSRGEVSLQHDRILRDALLMKVVCESGGILMPHNAVLMNNTSVIWDEVGRSPEHSVLVAGINGNTEYGCPIIATRGGSTCKDVIVTALFTAGSMREFYGGLSFSGGSTKILERLGSSGISIQDMKGVVTIRSDELTQMGGMTSYHRDATIIVFPFPQDAGVTSIPRKDEWIYAESKEGLLKNDMVIRDVFVKSLRR